MCSFSKLINDAMIGLKKDEQSLAEDFDVSVDSVKRWRSGETQPSDTVLRHVVNCLFELAKKELSKDIDNG